MTETGSELLMGRNKSIWEVELVLVVDDPEVVDDLSVLVVGDLLDLQVGPVVREQASVAVVHGAEGRATSRLSG